MKLIRADYIMIAAVVLLIGVHMITNFTLSYYKDVARNVGVAESVVMEMETNPIARYFLGIERFKLIYSFILAPGVLVGFYWYMRRKYWEDKIKIEAFAVAFFMFMLLNILNDASLVIGMFV